MNAYLAICATLILAVLAEMRLAIADVKERVVRLENRAWER